MAPDIYINPQLEETGGNDTQDHLCSLSNTVQPSHQMCGWLSDVIVHNQKAKKKTRTFNLTPQKLLQLIIYIYITYSYNRNIILQQCTGLLYWCGGKYVKAEYNRI